MKSIYENQDKSNQDDVSELESSRWIISYADFITLLFALFVVLYAMSSVNQQKYETVISSISKALKIQTPVISQIPPYEENNSTINTSSTVKPDTDLINTEFDILKKNIHQTFDGVLPDNLVSIRDDRDWIEIELKNSVLFDPGSAKLITSSYDILKKISLKLNSIPNIIQVEGFTDDAPVKNQLYPSNWELSAARSAAIVRKLEEFGIQSERLSVVGYGKNYPVADNKLDNGPAQNRRVKLLILKYGKRNRLETTKYVSPLMPYKQAISTNPQDIHPVDLDDGNIRYTNVKDRKASSFDLK
jgi:chemotaxis protein MotB